MPFCFAMLNFERGRRAQLQILLTISQDSTGRFHLLCSPSSPCSLSTGQSDSDRVYKAEALSEEEESNKSMGVGEQEHG